MTDWKAKMAAEINDPRIDELFRGRKRRTRGHSSVSSSSSTSSSASHSKSTKSKGPTSNQRRLRSNRSPVDAQEDKENCANPATLSSTDEDATEKIVFATKNMSLSKSRQARSIERDSSISYENDTTVVTFGTNKLDCQTDGFDGNGGEGDNEKTVKLNFTSDETKQASSSSTTVTTTRPISPVDISLVTKLLSTKLGTNK